MSRASVVVQRSWWLAALVAMSAGSCNAKQQHKPAPTSTVASSAPSATVKGLDAPDNDQTVVALARPVLSCPWQQTGFKPGCADLEAWEKSTLFADGKADSTLVGMLEDPREQVRYLAAGKLRRQGKAYREDEALAQRVLAVAQAETSTPVARELGAALAGVDASKTGVGPAIQKLLSDAKVPALRQSLIANVLVRNASFYDQVAKLAKDDQSGAVRLAAVSSFWGGTPPDKYGETCALWLDRATSDTDPATAGQAAHLCALFPQGGGCKDQWDELLATIEKKSEAKKIVSAQMAAALGNLYRHEATSPEQKKRALGLARAIVDNKDNAEYARARALKVVGQNDAAGAKAFARKFEDDSHPSVKAEAKRILEGDKKPADAGD